MERRTPVFTCLGQLVVMFLVAPAKILMYKLFLLLIRQCEEAGRDIGYSQLQMHLHAHSNVHAPTN